MLQNKVFIITIVIFLSICKAHAQPSPKRFYFNGNISISDNNKKVSFITKDSVNFTSLNSKIELSTYIIEIGAIKNNIQFKFERKVNNCFQIRTVKTEYWNGNKIGAFKFLFEIKKEKKTMLVYFDFTNNPKNDTKLKKFNIPFQQGEFEVTNPENPKLIAIKEMNKNVR
jgi:hypothetical protein